MRRLLHEALGYGAVSAISLGADFGILAILVQWLHWPTLIAATTSFLAGACVAYALSVRYVFSQHRLRSRRAEFVGFVALGTIGLAVNLAVIYVATGLLGTVDIVPDPAGLAADFQAMMAAAMAKEVADVMLRSGHRSTRASGSSGRWRRRLRT